MIQLTDSPIPVRLGRAFYGGVNQEVRFTASENGLFERNSEGDSVIPLKGEALVNQASLLGKATGPEAASLEGAASLSPTLLVLGRRPCHPFHHDGFRGPRRRASRLQSLALRSSRPQLSRSFGLRLGLRERDSDPSTCHSRHRSDDKPSE